MEARVLPSLSDAVNGGDIPHGLIFSFAALCAFYACGEMTENGFVGMREVNGKCVPYSISDSKEVLAFFSAYGHEQDILTRFASQTAFWGMDLCEIPNFETAAQHYYDSIKRNGVLSAMQEAVHASKGV